MTKFSHKIYPFERRSKRGTRLRKHPLFFAILIDAGMRAWREPIVNNNGLQQGEFVLSKTEYENFGLKKSQWNQISTALEALEQAGYIKKTGRRLGSQKSTIYRFLPNELFMPIRMSGTDSGNESNKIGTELGTNKENNKEKERKGESATLADSFSDEELARFVDLFKKATKEKVRMWTGDKTEDIKYMKKILADTDMRQILDKLCVEGGGPCDTLEDQITIYCRSLKWLLGNNKYWPKKLSSMKSIYDNFGPISNDF